LFQFITNKSIEGLKANPHWVDQESEILSLCFRLKRYQNRVYASFIKEDISILVNFYYVKKLTPPPKKRNRNSRPEKADSQERQLMADSISRG
jgi:hypothetical protein